MIRNNIQLNTSFILYNIFDHTKNYHQGKD